MPSLRATASRTRKPSVITSLPMPSPGITAILYFLADAIGTNSSLARCGELGSLNRVSLTARELPRTAAVDIGHASRFPAALHGSRHSVGTLSTSDPQAGL